MFILLIGSLLFLMILIYFSNNKDYASPGFITVFVFFISSVALSIQKNKWNIDLSSRTVFVILLFLCVFITTEYITQFLIFRENTFVPIRKKVGPLTLNRYLVCFMLGFSILVAIFYYKEIKVIAINAGYSEGDSLIQYARLGMLQGGAKTSFILSLATLISRAFSYISVFVFSYNICITEKNGKFRNVIYIIQPIIYLAQYTLSGSRGAYIELLSFFLVTFVIFNRKIKRIEVLNKRKVLIVGILTFILFTVAFIFAGQLKGWEGKSSIDILSLYFGGSIGALDNFLNSHYKEVSSSFGQETFIGINTLLSRLGIYTESFSRILPFTRVGYSSEMVNVYTSIRRYIHDFGYFGMVMCSFLLAFYEYVMVNYKRGKKINYLYFFYSLNFMMLVYQSIDEQFFVSLLSVNQIVTLVFTYMLYKFLLEKQLNFVEDNTY